MAAISNPSGIHTLHSESLGTPSLPSQSLQESKSVSAFPRSGLPLETFLGQNANASEMGVPDQYTSAPRGSNMASIGFLGPAPARRTVGANALQEAQF